MAYFWIHRETADILIEKCCPTMVAVKMSQLMRIKTTTTTTTTTDDIKQ